MISRRARIVAAVLSVIGLSAAGASAVLMQKADPKPVALSAAVTKVVARGRIEPVQRVRVVQGPGGAILRKVFVRDGDVVSADTVLAETEMSPSMAAVVALEKNRLIEAERSVLQVSAPAKRSEVQAQQAVIRQRAVELDKAEKEYDRARKLAANEAVSQEIEQSRRAARDEAVHALQQAESTYRSLTETRDVDLLVAQARLEVQRAVVTKAEADLELTRIRAPLDGTVLMLMAREGEALGTDGLLHMADLRNLQVVAEVDEAQISRVRTGQSATITGAALPEPVKGAVLRISHAVFKQKRPTSDVLIGRDARIIEVEITPDSPLPPVIGAEVTVSLDRGQP